MAFQSSPGLEAGCDAAWVFVLGFAGSFNPHPAWRPGATSTVNTRTHTTHSFNPHPAWRPGATPKPKQRVIATRFQSSPGLEAGCDVETATLEPPEKRFNPHPAWRPGATGATISTDAEGGVSILTRLGGRVRPRPPLPFVSSSLFQSSPGLEAGCDDQKVADLAGNGRFQSSPGLEAGCDNRASAG